MHTFLPPEKKEHLEDLGGALERPGGYQRLTFGQPSVNPRSTLGQRWVSSLAIAGRFSLILPDSSIKTEDRRTCISQMVDFPIRKRDFRVRSWSGAFWEPQERKKKRKPNVPTRFAFLCTAPNSNLQFFAPLIFTIFRDLQDVHSFAPLQIQKICKFCQNNCAIFRKISQILLRLW